jgi:hypothetical protein
MVVEGESRRTGEGGVVSGVGLLKVEYGGGTDVYSSPLLGWLGSDFGLAYLALRLNSGAAVFWDCFGGRIEGIGRCGGGSFGTRRKERKETAGGVIGP